MLALAPTADVVLGLTLAVGLAGVLAVSAIERLSSFKRDAGARFHLWFVLLVLAVAAPLVAGATIAAFRAEPAIDLPATSAVGTIAQHVQQTTRVSVIPAVRQPTAVYRPPDPVKPRFPVAAALVMVWAIGALAFLARLAIGVTRLRRLTHNGRLLETRSVSLRRVRIIEHPSFSIPVAIGYRRPAVLMPRALLATTSEADLENILLHELEHLRRFDDVTSFLQSMCVALVWFNPFVHYVARRLAAEREMACDEAVVRRIGKRHGYASTLWNIALTVSDSLVPTFGSAFASGSQTANRVANLLETVHARVSRPMMVAVALTIVAAFGGVSIGVAAAVGSARTVITDVVSVTLNDGTTLVVGGRNPDGTPVDDAVLYRGKRRIGTAALSTPRWSTTLTRLHSGDILVTGGMTPAGTTADVELFRLRTRKFEHVGDLHVARVAHTATLLADGTVLVAAGERAPGKLESSTELYDPAHRRFRLTADGYGRISQTALRIDHGDVLMMGGDPGRGRKNCSIIYSATRHTYHDAGTLVRATEDRLTFRLPNGVYVSHTID